MTTPRITCFICNQSPLQGEKMTMMENGKLRHEQPCEPPKSYIGLSEWAIDLEDAIFRAIDHYLKSEKQVQIEGSPYKMNVYRMDGGYENVKKRIRIDLTEK